MGLANIFSKLLRNYDKKKRGVIAAKDLWHILAKWGEKLSAREGQLVTSPFCLVQLFLGVRLEIKTIPNSS